MKAQAFWAALGAAVMIGLAQPALAVDADVSKQIISSVSVASYQVNGQQGGPEIRKDPAVQGGKAIRVHVAAKGANPWDVALGVPILKPVKAGDTLVMAFWAKLVEGENGATTATLPFCAIQVASPPYATVISGGQDIGTAWKLYNIVGKADKDYKPGEVGATIHLATAKQVIDFGPVFVLDLGQQP